MKNPELEFKVNTVGFLKEVFDNNPKLGGVLYKPANIFKNLLAQVGERAAQLNDNKLNALMCQLGIYSVSDPYSPDFDAEIAKQTIIKKYIDEQSKEILIGSRVERIGSLKDYTTGRQGTVQQISGERLQVCWLYESSGKPVLSSGKNTGNGIKTWVSSYKVKLLTLAILLLAFACSPKYPRCPTYGNMQGSKNYYTKPYKHLNP